MLTAFRERHAYVVDALNKIPGLSCIKAGGAFYAFPDARGAIASLHGKGLIAAPTDIALSEYLLGNAGVAVVPGSAFGSDGYIRLSFATSMENLKNAIERMAKALG
jgi:aspartate aminotransferase